MKKQYQLVDIFKLFFALCVVSIHTNLFEDISSVFNNTLSMLLWSMVVPFFYITAGYFFTPRMIEFKICGGGE